MLLVDPIASLTGVGVYFVYPFLVLGFIVPLGPISIAVQGAGFIFGFVGLLSEVFRIHYPYSWVVAAVLAAALKCVIYLLLRRSRLLNRSAISVLFIATLILLTATLVGCVVIHCYIIYAVWGCISTALVRALIITVPIDLTLLSYTKYRDAINNTAHKYWIPALTTLWSITIWLPAMISPDYWWDFIRSSYYSISPNIVIGIWITITIIQILFAIKYYYIAKKTHSNAY